jgi:hypothetical protein
MANESDHIECANRTQKTIAHLLSDRATHSPWIATLAFYKAVHIVEAVFSNDRSIVHTSSHSDRENALKRTRKYENIYRNYAPLYRASQNARYLSGCANFDELLSPDEVVDKLLKHHLRQIENSARKILQSPSALVGIETATT